MKRVAFAVPGDLATPTGGYAYDRRMIVELVHLGWGIDAVNLGANFPRPGIAERKTARQQLMAVPAGLPIVIDGLAYGVLPDVASELAAEHPVVALVHHPLALESGLSADEAEEFRASERAALTQATHIIVTSATTARLLEAEYDVPGDRVTVVCPGIDPVPPAATRSDDGIVQLLAIGAIVPRKGYDVLIEALAALIELPWHLTIAGDNTRHREAARRLEADISRLRLGERVSVLGAVSDARLAELYAGAHVFALASRYEGYGMVFSEAIAHGLPVIGTRAGAIPETVPDEAGILVPPDDAAALAEALRRVIQDPEERIRMATAARAAARNLPTWQDWAKIFAGVLQSLA